MPDAYEALDKSMHDRGQLVGGSTLLLGIFVMVFIESMVRNGVGHSGNSVHQGGSNLLLGIFVMVFIESMVSGPGAGHMVGPGAGHLCCVYIESIMRFAALAAGWMVGYLSKFLLALEQSRCRLRKHQSKLIMMLKRPCPSIGWSMSRVHAQAHARYDAVMCRVGQKHNNMVCAVTSTGKVDNHTLS